MLFIETPIFTKEVRVLLRDDEYRALQSAILLRPEQGAVIPGGGVFENFDGPYRGRANVEVSV